MISCLERCNEPARALEVFERMQTAGAPGPGAATYATLCDMLAKQGKWDRLRTAVQVRGAWAMQVQGRAGCGGISTALHGLRLLSCSRKLAPSLHCLA